MLRRRRRGRQQGQYKAAHSPSGKGEKQTAEEEEEEERERTTLFMSSSIRYIYSVRWGRGVIRLLRWKQAQLQPDQLQQLSPGRKTSSRGILSLSLSNSFFLFISRAGRGYRGRNKWLSFYYISGRCIWTIDTGKGRCSGKITKQNAPRARRVSSFSSSAPLCLMKRGGGGKRANKK